jgi:phosphate transport system protein
MTMHLQRDLEQLRKQLIDLGSRVETSTRKIVEAIVRRDPSELEGLEAAEEVINRLEVDIENECLKILALHQPVAGDLRFIIVVLKVNNDLERMADQAVNLTERVQAIADSRPLEVSLPFAEMGEYVKKMVSLSLDALLKADTSLAREVLDMDDRLDELHASVFSLLREHMRDLPDSIPAAVSCITISTNLERMGDLATNIAEEVIFMEEGSVVRHTG